MDGRPADAQTLPRPRSSATFFSLDPRFLVFTPVFCGRWAQFQSEHMPSQEPSSPPHPLPLPVPPEDGSPRLISGASSAPRPPRAPPSSAHRSVSPSVLWSGVYFPTSIEADAPHYGSHTSILHCLILEPLLEYSHPHSSRRVVLGARGERRSKCPKFFGSSPLSRRWWAFWRSGGQFRNADFRPPFYRIRTTFSTLHCKLQCRWE